MKKREIQRTKRALHTTYTEGNCYIVKKESSDWPMVIQPISGWMGTGIQYPDFWPRAFAKFKFCLESRCNSWPGSISISSTIPLQNDAPQGVSFESFFPSAQSAQVTAKCSSVPSPDGMMCQGHNSGLPSYWTPRRAEVLGHFLHSPHRQKQELLPEDSGHVTVILR